MLKIKVYNTDKSVGAEGFINPNQIILMSEVFDTGFSRVRMVDGYICFVDKEGHEKILNYFKPKKWWQLNK